MRANEASQVFILYRVSTGLPKQTSEQPIE